MSQNDPLKIAGRQISDALTFDDVLLQPGYSKILPNDTNIKTRLTRTINLHLPFENSYTDVFLPDVGYRHDINGLFWYRRIVTLDDVDLDYELTIGSIDDGDITYINGRRVGATYGALNKRNYKVPKEILHKGDNVIAMMHFDHWGGSAILGPIYLQNVRGDKVLLEGSWSGILYADLFDSELIIYGLKNQNRLRHRPSLRTKARAKSAAPEPTLSHWDRQASSRLLASEDRLQLAEILFAPGTCVR